MLPVGKCRYRDAFRADTHSMSWVDCLKEKSPIRNKIEKSGVLEYNDYLVPEDYDYDQLREVRYLPTYYLHTSATIHPGSFYKYKDKQTKTGIHTTVASI